MNLDQDILIAIDNDPNVVLPLRRLIALQYDNSLSEEKFKQIAERFEVELTELYQYDPLSLKRSINYLKSTYPVVADGLKEQLDRISNNIFDLESEKMHVTPTSSTVKRSTDTEMTRNNTDGASNGSGSCFVATAAFGTPLAAEVAYLRKWRDTRLQYSYVGRTFIKFYYRHGPSMAQFVNDHPWTKRHIRSVIRWIIAWLRKTGRI